MTKTTKIYSPLTHEYLCIHEAIVIVNTAGYPSGYSTTEPELMRVIGPTFRVVYLDRARGLTHRPFSRSSSLNFGVFFRASENDSNFLRRCPSGRTSCCFSSRSILGQLRVIRRFRRLSGNSCCFQPGTLFLHRAPSFAN